MATSVLVGIGGGEPSQRAAKWAARQAAAERASLTLLTVLDVDALREYGAEEEAARYAAKIELERTMDELAQVHPSLEMHVEIVTGRVVEKLVDAADAHDLVVLGTHHGRTIVQTFGGATALRVSVSAVVPTVVVPADWSDDYHGTGIMVGVGPDKVSERAIGFATNEALLLGEPLQLTAMWGLPAVLSRPAEMMGGGLGPVGQQRQQELDERAAALKGEHPGLQVEARAIECSSPARGFAENSEGFRMLVMGTHSRSTFGRTLFGSVTHGVLLNLRIPTVIVPAV